MNNDEPWTPEHFAVDKRRTAFYGEPGLLQLAQRQLGFMPETDAVAFAILKSIVLENEEMRRRLGKD